MLYCQNYGCVAIGTGCDLYNYLPTLTCLIGDTLLVVGTPARDRATTTARYCCGALSGLPGAALVPALFWVVVYQGPRT